MVRKFDPLAFTTLIERAAKEVGISLAPQRHQAKARRVVRKSRALDLALVVLPPSPELRAELWEYIRLRPDADEALPRFGRTRSEIEQSIFCSLVRQGWTDEEIEAFASQRGLARYMEEHGVTDYGERSVRNARLYVEENAWQDEAGISEEAPTSARKTEQENVSFYKGIVAYQSSLTEKDNSPVDLLHVVKNAKARYLRWYVLRLVNGQRAKAFYQSASEELGVSERTVERAVAWLSGKKRGYVEKVRDGKAIFLKRTHKGERAAAKKLCPAPLAKWLPSEAVFASQARRREAEQEKAQLERRPRRSPQPLTEAAKKAGNLNRLAKRSWYDGRHRLSFLGHRRTFHIQFLTPPDEATLVRFHEQRIVGWAPPVDGYAVPVYANFISRTDPSIEGRAGYDPLITRFAIKPNERQIAVAVSMRLTEDGFEPDEAIDLNGELIPAVGLVVQGPKNFFGPLYSTADWTDRIIEVKRTGRDDGREFHFRDLDAGPDLEIDERHMIDLDRYVEEIASEDRIRSLIDPLPDHWRFW